MPTEFVWFLVKILHSKCHVVGVKCWHKLRLQCIHLHKRTRLWLVFLNSILFGFVWQIERDWQLRIVFRTIPNPWFIDVEYIFWVSTFFKYFFQCFDLHVLYEYEYWSTFPSLRRKRKYVFWSGSRMWIVPNWRESKKYCFPLSCRTWVALKLCH